LTAVEPKTEVEGKRGGLLGEVREDGVGTLKKKPDPE
jgi:hypothetical protein